LYCVLIVFSLHRESLKLILKTNPSPRWFCHIEVSRPKSTEMHYVTRRSHWMEKHKFGVTCPDVLFVESTSVSPLHEI
jgi:hypothetical protein